MGADHENDDLAARDRRRSGAGYRPAGHATPLARQVPDRATIRVAVLTVGPIMFCAPRLALPLSSVSFGALTGLLLVHAPVARHFVRRKRSRDWLRRLIAPAAPGGTGRHEPGGRGAIRTNAYGEPLQYVAPDTV